MNNLKIMLKSFFTLLLFVSIISLSACNKEENQTAGDNKENSTESSDENNESGNNESSGDIDLSSNEFIITYKMTGPESNGTMTLYRMGDNMKTVMKGQIADMENGVAEALYDGDFVYTTMELQGQKQGFKLKVDEYQKDKEYSMADVEKNLEKYKKVGTETILGKECEIYETGKGTTISVYDKKAVLGIKSKDMTMVATEFNTDPNLSESDFEVPKDVEFIDMEEMMKGMKNLKNMNPNDMKIPGTK
jgi:hypothetical protein